MPASGQITACDGYRSAAEAAIARDVSIMHLYNGEPPHSYAGNKASKITGMNWSMDLALAKQLVADDLTRVHAKFALLAAHTDRGRCVCRG